MLALWQGMQLGEVPPGDAAHEPLFLQQGGAGVQLVLPAGRQRLQQPRLALTIQYAVDQRLPRLMQQRGYLPALEGLPGAQLRWQRPVIELRQGVGEHRLGQRVHP